MSTPVSLLHIGATMETKNLITQAAYMVYGLSKKEVGIKNDLTVAFDAWVMSMPCPCDAPILVRRAVVFRFIGDPDQMKKSLAELMPMGGYWGFTWAGMFVGIEPDGYMHT